MTEISDKPKHPGGRPRTKTPTIWTPEQIENIDKMARAQCKDTTIADALGVDEETFKREFRRRTRQKRAEGKIVVQQIQYEGCLTRGTGGVTERIWFGKQHLEQSDRQDHRLSGSVKVLPPLIK